MNRKKWTRVGQFGVVVMAPVLLWAYQFGPDAHHTAVPGTGETSCNESGCHVGTALNGGGGKVTLTAASGSTYTPGQKQTLTIDITDSVARVYGFEITARLASDHTKQAGTFTPGVTEAVLCAAISIGDLGTNRPSAGCPANKPLEFAEHTNPFRTNIISIDWTPPATASGNIDIYVSANAANGDMADTGDHIYTTSLTLTPAVAPPSCTGSAPCVNNVINLTGFGGKTGVAPGSWIEIYGSNFATTSGQWAGADFTGPNAPTMLNNIGVTVAGKPAFVYYYQSNQLDVQVPDGIGTGMVPVIVTVSGTASSAFNVMASNILPGILAPPSGFLQNGKQYVAAQFTVVASDGTRQAFFAGDPAVIPGTLRPVKPGEVITLYGIGFGPVTPTAAGPAIPVAGVVVGAPNSINGTLAIRFGQIQASAVAYKGLAVGPIGLYQFNLTVPANVPDGDLAFTVTLDGVDTGQNMFIPVKK